MGGLVQSHVRDRARRELVRMIEARPSYARDVDGDGGFDRTVDRWTVYDVWTAVRSVSMTRYRHRKYESAARREAITEVHRATDAAKVALANLADVLTRLAEAERRGG